jgi:hypothetical protein
MTGATQQKQGAATNGQGDPKMAEAIAYEAQIADEAESIRKDATELTPELFMKLWPLLKRPIPEAFIQTVPPTKGKPYESTGIRSVQVQIDRMNNVLTPLWWWDQVEYFNDGKLATVTVFVGNQVDNAVFRELLHRSSRGGVEQGSTAGNIHKGSYTNAAKLAFARIGVGHEVYLGAADMDPDVSRDLAEQAKGDVEPSTIGKVIAKNLVDRTWNLEGSKEKLQLAASHVAGRDVGDCSTKAKATTALAGLTYEQADRLDNRITEKEAEASDGS